MNTQLNISDEKKMGRPSIFKFIFSPSLEMEKMVQKPVIWMPLLITILLGIVSGVVYSLIPNVMRDIEKQTGMEAESMQMITMIFGAAGILITTPIILFVTSAIMYGAAKLFKGQVTFKALFSFSIFLLLLTNIGTLFNCVIAYFLDAQPNFTSLNGFLNETGKLGDFFNSIEIFTIWTSFLSGLAFNKMANLSKGISIGLGIAAFILSLLIGTLTGGFQ